MHAVENLSLLPVWVNPDHLVSTARHVLLGHKVRVLAVLENGELVGLLTRERLVGAPDEDTVASIMEPATLVLEGSTTIRRVAETFVQDGIDVAPVVRDGRFLGLVTSNMLLRELGRSWDPLTGLSWSDYLREWGIDNLRRGNEITILFIDLDEFGLYNKRFGHIVGDKVLRRVATMIRESLEPAREVLVRFGGDEFAIGTLRNREEAEALGETLKRKMRELFIADTEEPVTFCVGIFGGKRTRERDKVHYAATLDNLINLASKDCLAQKAAAQAPPPPAALGRAAVNVSPPAAPEPEPEPETKVIGVYADEVSTNGMTTVILGHGDAVVSGVNSRLGRPVIESVAVATARALERAFPETMIQVQDIHLAESDTGKKLVHVSAQVVAGERTLAASGVIPVDRDLYRSVAEATVQAILSLGGPPMPAAHR